MLHVLIKTTAALTFFSNTILLSHHAQHYATNSTVATTLTAYFGNMFFVFLQYI